MRFLADENFPYPVAAALRSKGHDVRHVAESNATLPDEDVLALALTESRVLLTRDKGFGRLVFRKQLPTAGVILVRLGSADWEEMLRAMLWLIDSHGDMLKGRYTTLKNDNVRVRPILRMI